MSSNQRPVSALGASSGVGGGREKTYFETQREALIGEIAMSFEHVLANINKLNRSLEAVIAVGNEFSSVEALWSQFENVMAKDPEDEQGEGENDKPEDQEHEEGERTPTKDEERAGR
ncbi:hypothetical protein JX265_013042 [Neoarthrinium moseri]|uniref:DASH complex subunit DAD1 n=1 Tax=Neoarthrinium moseri TaxID=1658444 RepID=A0A9P9W996_9PEZI|nr:uncharacterized protein JN550_005821 [Neoarthrinium moseri]KAI1852189.1 hypothetical protein JX265_013042 [Neoarthrinium moseri]KAI1869191.1 hypothetical protein JN550_005821 [Neoarthrinium moseri]